MKVTRRAAMVSIGVALLWASLATGVQGHIGAPREFGSGLGKAWVQLKGHVLCAGCTLEELQANPPPLPAHLYQLNHRRGQTVMQVNPDDASLLLYHRLWLKGGDQLFKTLTAEENLSKEIEVFPQSAEVKGEDSLMWVNSFPILAQVVFDADLWQKVVLARGEQETYQAREFSLPFGTLTICTLGSGTYTVPCLSWQWF